MSTPLKSLAYITDICGLRLVHDVVPGWYINVEGTDGVGKTRLVKSLTERLRHEKFNVHTTREPGGSPMGHRIRGVIERYGHEMSAGALEALFLVDRSAHVSQFLIPTLRERGGWGGTKANMVLSDRSVDSGLAYATTREVMRLSPRINFSDNIDRVLFEKSLEEIARSASGVLPNHTIYLHAEIPTILDRLVHRRIANVLENEKRTASADDIKSFREQEARRVERIAWQRKAYDTLYSTIDEPAGTPSDLRRTVSYIDTTRLTLDEVTDEAMRLIRNVIDSAGRTALLKRK